MADRKLEYGTASDVTITLASLASDTNLLVGRQSAAIDNSATGTKFLDYLVSGKITAGTSPSNTGSQSIEVWAVASWDGTTWPAGFTASDAGRTLASANIKAAVCQWFVAALACDTTSNQTYEFSGVSLQSVFRGNIPPKFAFFVVHNMRTSAPAGVALNATASNHQLRLQPVYETLN
jgi:hypothetical protein